MGSDAWRLRWTPEAAIFLFTFGSPKMLSKIIKLKTAIDHLPTLPFLKLSQDCMSHHHLSAHGTHLDSSIISPFSYIIFKWINILYIRFYLFFFSTLSSCILRIDLHLQHKFHNTNLGKINYTHPLPIQNLCQYRTQHTALSNFLFYILNSTGSIIKLT